MESKFSKIVLSINKVLNSKILCLPNKYNEVHIKSVGEGYKKTHYILLSSRLSPLKKVRFALQNGPLE